MGTPNIVLPKNKIAEFCIKNHNYNPDVLTCIANLSSDEVFTPPKLVNPILDLLPVEIWSEKEATFLDPVCKSGVFLREIAVIESKIRPLEVERE